MAHEFDAAANVHVDRDERGVVSDILHLEEVYTSTAPTAQLAAREYLDTFGPMLGVASDQLRNFSLQPEGRPNEDGVEYRFLSEAAQFDAVTVTFSQTYDGIPVWGAGLAVTMLQRPFRVLSAQSTSHVDLHADVPPKAALERAQRLTPQLLARHLGIADAPEWLDHDLRIERQRPYVYRYEAEKRTHEIAEFTSTRDHNPDREYSDLHGRLVLPLPPVPPKIREGEHYFVSAVYFELGARAVPNLHWVALVEVETLAVLLLRAFVDTVDGLVFVQDPTTTNGGPPPSASNAALNAVRSAVALPGLEPPGAGQYALVGNLVQILDVEPPPIAPPTEPVGTDFDFDARTDNFSAANAYYHADRFFRLVSDLGFPVPTFFGGTLFPSVVDHRGLGGNVVNAHCLGNGAFGIEQTTFGLADTGNVAQPIGIACDWRVVLHELGGHGTLYNHVNWPNFGFSHSAGDSFGAVLNDFDSRAPDRFVSFPWVNIGRRHDRTPAAGWGWNGPIGLNPFTALDPGGYNNEQILCTTHFHIYRSIGGDSTEQAMRRFAGRYVAYLILRTIGGLTAATNPPNATVYAAALTSADLGNWTTESEVGGCYAKVIRWAFEKQGLYQPATTPKPNDDEGAPPPVDVYIDDGRHGEYHYDQSGQFFRLQKFWETTEIWNRHEPDGQAIHQTPIVGRPNFAYVRIKNRGTLTAHNITIRGWHCRPSAGLVWPDDWKPMTTAARTVAALASGGETRVGPLEWTPEVHGHECMFMSVSAPGDRANNDTGSGLNAAAGPTPLWRLVPCDNNLGLRAVIPVPGGGHREELIEAFRERRFWAGNPFPHTATMGIRCILPPFLASRGWAVKLDNPGAGTFTLGARNSREIRPRLVGGQDFGPTDLQAAGVVSIECIVLADELVVGGLTFVLDPDLKRPAPESDRHEDQPREAHLDENRREKNEERHEHREDRPRRIRVDIDLD